jgi:hypothetical protein
MMTELLGFIQGYNSGLSERGGVVSKDSGVSLASDYATFETANGDDYYYGYEVTTDDEGEGDWCFQLHTKQNDNAVIYTFTYMKNFGASDMFDCGTNLLIGIKALIDNGVLSLPKEL